MVPERAPPVNPAKPRRTPTDPMNAPLKSTLAAAAEGTAGLAERLAAISGLVVRPNHSLAKLTTFQIGGPADLLVEVANQRALGHLLREVEAASAPFHLLGLGSNVLVPDAGLRGVVARLGGELRRARVRGELVSAGGALPLATLARRTVQRGLVGLEALAGFPSTVGGAVFMNAGCYGTEIKDLLVSATVLERDGRRHRVTLADLAPAYRSTSLRASGAVVTRAVLQLRAGDGARALRRIDEINAQRRRSLPSSVPNAGSTFRNPPGDYAGRLIEACGLKGLTEGGAQISSVHANVIVNRGGALAEQVVTLMRVARAAVEERFGVVLVPELILLGDLAERFARVP
jgi:UDP-N-acetylmuramate dehydrogenase